MGLQISVTFTKMTTTFKILCSSLQTLAVPSSPLRCLLWSFAVFSQTPLSAFFSTTPHVRR